ncbi:MAG: hypothetical protein DI535_13080 [Citrobacter freundii]|nr:MAG: hypothetical protein DI535_13080 [Citrobacter freundii]
MKLVTAYTLGVFEVHHRHMDRIPPSPEMPDPYNSWMAISNFIRDVHQINKRLASDGFTAEVLEKAKEICDESRYLQLTARIKRYD